MEKTSEMTKIPSTRHRNLKKSFKLAIRSLLTACPKEEFCNAFTNFTSAEQELLHRQFIQIIASLHENIEDEFESLFRETQDKEKKKVLIARIELMHKGIHETVDSLKPRYPIIGLLNSREQAGAILDTVEQHVEEQSDPLLNEKSGIEAIGQTLSDAKRNEIHCLMGMLEKAEEQKRHLSDHLALLKKEKQDFSGSADVVDRLWMEIQSYGTGNRNDPMI